MNNTVTASKSRNISLIINFRDMFDLSLNLHEQLAIRGVEGGGGGGVAFTAEDN